MQRFRKTTRTHDIARGPGRLAQAMQIDKRYDGVLGPGYCYVYFTYGSSFMVNVTSEEPGVGAGCS